MGISLPLFFFFFSGRRAGSPGTDNGSSPTPYYHQLSPEEISLILLPKTAPEHAPCVCNTQRDHHFFISPSVFSLPFVRPMIIIANSRFSLAALRSLGISGARRRLNFLLMINSAVSRTHARERCVWITHGLIELPRLINLNHLFFFFQAPR